MTVMAKIPPTVGLPPQLHHPQQSPGDAGSVADIAHDPDKVLIHAELFALAMLAMGRGNCDCCVNTDRMSAEEHTNALLEQVGRLGSARLPADVVAQYPLTPM